MTLSVGGFGSLAVAVIAALNLGTAAHAQDFTCFNKSSEISCTDGTCSTTTPSDGFTPMELRRTGSRIELCAYSGCWDGPIHTRLARGDFTMIYAIVKNVRQRGAGQTPVALIYNRATRSAQLTAFGFANTMDCRHLP